MTDEEKALQTELNKTVLTKVREIRRICLCNLRDTTLFLMLGPGFILLSRGSASITDLLITITSLVFYGVACYCLKEFYISLRWVIAFHGIEKDLKD